MSLITQWDKFENSWVNDRCFLLTVRIFEYFIQRGLFLLNHAELNQVFYCNNSKKFFCKFHINQLRYMKLALVATIKNQSRKSY